VVCPDQLVRRDVPDRAAAIRLPDLVRGHRRVRTGATDETGSASLSTARPAVRTGSAAYRLHRRHPGECGRRSRAGHARSGLRRRRAVAQRLGRPGPADRRSPRPGGSGVTIQPIRVWGDPVLRGRATEVTTFDNALRSLIVDMFETT